MRNVEKQRKYWREWYRRNKTDATKKIYFNRVTRRKKLRDWYRAYKAKLKCVRCGFSHPAVIDFHHRDPKFKEFSIAEIFTFSQSISRLKVELEKCDPLCANCHRILHYEE